MSSPGRPDSPNLNPPPSSPLPLLPPFRAPSGTSRPTATDTARQQGALLGLLSSVCRVIESLYQDLRFMERRFGGDAVRAPKQQLEERRKRVRIVWKTVEKHPGLAWEGEVVRLCERMLGDILKGSVAFNVGRARGYRGRMGLGARKLVGVGVDVYHPFINNGESTTTFMAPWGEYLGTFTGTISDVEEEVDKAVKKLTANDRKTSGTYGGAGSGGGVRIESLMRPLG
ncbi:hypothetical protein GE21DRAFT_2831 [Neurospora crassa]|uniref:Uncharacterized protein n=2 Tax=Neurospora crassa TaxID=5141 RepID=Q1K5C4_NEUCR|nr:hypothetical protein NCU03424 [Neurospora crassa OR74A]EAA27474.1 hypothetical protein NCU03424 [Neurospora crassa OR74A]KHE86382.1 hypothetical protein GE21DRAFT_2831 [Neurospora crassa]CAD21137.1 hypothetical protein [Neurospora crassa]|eukprot:XP_956710.1 hypothetical protein NCU03424 [Neurospora crassa OR74A]